VTKKSDNTDYPPKATAGHFLRTLFYASIDPSDFDVDVDFDFDANGHHFKEFNCRFASKSLSNQKLLRNE